MIARGLGRDRVSAGAVALGCMGFSEFYGTVAEADALRAIERALDLGLTLLDTSDMYGIGANEHLVGRAVRGRRGDALISTKGGLLRRHGDPHYRAVDGTPDHLRAALDASLARLGVDHVDLYYLHRADPAIPIEESVGVLDELRRAGKTRAIGLSEVDAEQLRRAAAAAPIDALQSEWSLVTRDVEHNGVLAAVRELGITFVAYAPLGRGLLTGAIRGTDRLDEADLRRRVPRFDPEHLAENLALVDAFTALALERGCTSAQLALAWLLAQGDDVIALAGGETLAHVEENAIAAEIALDPVALARIDTLFRPGAAAGERIRPG